MNREDSEIDLVRRCRAGDRSAWDELVCAYYSDLIHEAQEHGASPEKAEWAVKTAFDVVFANHLASYERIEPHGWRLKNLLSVNVKAALHPRWHEHHTM